MRREKETRDQKRGEEEEGETDDRIIKEIWKIMKDRDTGCPPPTPKNPIDVSIREEQRSM